MRETADFAKTQKYNPDSSTKIATAPIAAKTVDPESGAGAVGSRALEKVRRLGEAQVGRLFDEGATHSGRGRRRNNRRIARGNARGSRSHGLRRGEQCRQCRDRRFALAPRFDDRRRRTW